MKCYTQVARNYASALVELFSIGGINSQEKLLEEIKLINDSLSLEGSLKKIFENPGVPKEEKKLLIKQIFDSKINQLVLNLLFLLIDKQRFYLLQDIQNELSRLINSLKGTVVAEVYSIKELDNSSLEELKNVIENTITKDKKVKIETKVDTSLIGGIKIKINNQLYDGSIKGRIEGLKRKILY